MAHEHAKHLMEDQTGRASVQIVVTLVGGILLIVAFIAQMLFEPTTPGYPPYQSQLLAMFAALLLGVPLCWQALKDLASGHTHMDELVALGVMAAFAMGAKGFFSGEVGVEAEYHGGFLEAGVIAFLMIIASLIEHRTALGARKSIESLVRITPTRAYRVGKDAQGNETETEVEASELTPGDVVRVRPGDNIPGDGRVVKGVSTVNQATITGESLPADKIAGDEVFGGTINVTGAMDIEITKAGKDTTLGRVKDLILQAEMTRSPIMRLADKYASWYTPVVLMIAAIVWILTRDMSRVVSLLIISCPCAIILATPTAMVAALSAAARLGVLVKNVTDLEVARNLTAIVFDKTGTLTTGQLTVTRLSPVDGVEGAALLETAATAEQNSKHPVARAVVEVARKARLNLAETEDFEEVSGRGVTTQVNDEKIIVGRETFVQEHGVDLSALDTTGSDGMSLLFVAKNGKAIGWIGLEDKTRDDAAMAIDQLRDQDIKQITMVTGDRWSVAKRVASEMHCSDVQAEVLPAQKLKIVGELKAMGHTVAVIGDGVNDAPALAAGDISIAMGAAGSDVAIHSASIALMNNNLNRIPFLVRLSRRAFGVVRQNMAMSVCYIVIFGGLSIMGMVEPIYAALLHAASSIVVVFNSARLVREGEDIEHAETEPAHLPKTDTGPAPAVQPVGQTV